ncbi:biotin transport system permease protein [Kytococcus aerolatus]|uniref:Biotin transport system permease protein n=1 Tax=Kytococcus aerolatus TaxID=592308 RepID=A0A212TFI4_9MICO|nr:energy-coupling factor transporter transmembrane protein EcfT [Kytococcus aerolatus]SNC64586.1 biotin transport system permease protein [Kytococcus aerolatus]
MNALGVAVPGDSWLHRLPAGWKVAGLAVATVAMYLVASWQLAVGLFVVALLVLASARVGWEHLRLPLRAVLVLVVVLGLVQWLFVDAAHGLRAAGRVGAALVLAWTVSLTTPVSEMMRLLQRALRPLGRLGVDTDHWALVVSMAVRSVPLMVSAAQATNEARIARGRGLSVRSFAIPLVVRAVRAAEMLGDALLARGYETQGKGRPRARR